MLVGHKNKKPSKGMPEALPHLKVFARAFPS